jgi:hypothetical protein
MVVFVERDAVCIAPAKPLFASWICAIAPAFFAMRLTVVEKA